MDMDAWLKRRVYLQSRLWEILGWPAIGVEPRAEIRDRFVWDGVIVEQIVYETEPGQSVPALLYLPENVAPPYPAISIAMGHGGSKTTPGSLYAGPLYAKLGIACLCADPNGEKERNIHGRRGTRTHDAADVSARSRAAGRSVVGKMVWDLMMGLSYLQTRTDIDPARLGCAGVSLGGTVNCVRPRFGLAIGPETTESESNHFTTQRRTSLGCERSICASSRCLWKDRDVFCTTRSAAHGLR